MDIQWDIGRIFRFEITSMNPAHSKKVCQGKFIGTAPDGLTPGVPYCIKIIDANVQDLSLPQCREYFELVDFRGEHLRPILARNPAAQSCAEQLRRNGTCHNATNCIIVEPVLQPSDPLFQDCSKKPIAMRLDALLQIATGCEELTNPENILGPYYIVAHRDLKAGNIMVAYLNNKPHYYLIDFASVRLNKEDPILLSYFPEDIPDNTFRGPISPHNTAPEDLEGSPFKISGKTDIYALGMLMAELFLTITDSPSNNPNARWVTLHGWNRTDPRRTLDNLNAGFTEALELYEPSATWDNTWIEQDLASHNRKLQWENIADPLVLTAIRKLFFDSTRIDPEKRVNLPEFIERLKAIIELERRSTSRIPLSIYLFDQTHFNQHRQSYRYAARGALESEKKVRGPSSAGLCVAFRRSLPTDRSMMDAVQLLGNAPLSNSNQLEAALQYCDTRNGLGENTALYALNFAVQTLLRLTSSEDSPYIFTGKIHLFSPEIPTLDSIAPIQKKDGQTVDLLGFADMMSTSFEGIPMKVFLYSSGAPQICSKDIMWYTHIPLNPPEEPAYATFRSAGSNPAPTVPVQNPLPRKSSAEQSSFYDGTFDYYIEGEDGSIIYVGMK